MKNIVLLIFTLLLSSKIFSQIASPQDCEGAIPICSEIYYEEETLSGEGNIENEIFRDYYTQCYTGELNGIWYIFTAQNTGMLKFNLIPDDPIDDLDWIIIDGTRITCAEIYENTDKYISSNTWGDSTYNGNTGAFTDSLGVGNCNGPGTEFGPRYNQNIPVYANRTYWLYISNFTDSHNGYTLDFSNSTASIEDIKPPLASVAYNFHPRCDKNIVEINFDEYVKCEDVTIDKFSISNNYNVEYEIVDIKCSQCDSGAVSGKYFTLVLDKNLFFGDYLINVSGGISDNCGNISPPKSMSFSVPEVIISDTILSSPDCETGIYDIRIIPQGSVSSFTYSQIFDNDTTTSNVYLFEISQSGEYSYFITNKTTKCKSEPISIQIDEYIPLSVEVNTTNISCYDENNGIIEIISNGGLGEINYSIDSGENFTSINIFENLEPQNYNILVSDENNCFYENENIILTQPDSISINYTSQNVDCYGNSTGEIELSILGGAFPYSVLWADNQIEQSIFDLEAGIYEATITDNNLCQKSIQIEITQPDSLIMNIITENVNCYGNETGNIFLEIEGGTEPYNFLWNNNQTTQNMEYIPAGDYEVIVNDENNCVINEQITIFQPDSLIISQNIINSTCVGGFDGSITIEIESGGVEPFVFEWNTGVTNQNLQNISSGVYTLNITDANNCEFEYSFELIEPEELIINFSKENVSCYGYSDAFISAELSDISANYKYLWNTGDTILFLDNLSVGKYNLIISDLYGFQCAFAETEIFEPDSLFFDFQTINVSCFGDNNGEIDGTIYGGTPNYEIFLIDENENVLHNLIDLPKGSYKINLIDNNNCTFVAETTISEPEKIDFEVSTTNSCSLEGNGEIEILAFGGTPNYLYFLDNELTNSKIIDLLPGIYTITVEDANNCFTTKNVEINEDYCPPEIETFNIFTPNSDDKNDYFYIKTKNVKSYNVFIFNRWGEEVFRLNEKNEFWNGKNQKGNIDLPEGTYFYIVTALGINGETFETKGVVNLIR